MDILVTVPAEYCIKDGDSKQMIYDVYTHIYIKKKKKEFINTHTLVCFVTIVFILFLKNYYQMLYNEFSNPNCGLRKMFEDFRNEEKFHSLYCYRGYFKLPKKFNPNRDSDLRIVLNSLCMMCIFEPYRISQIIDQECKNKKCVCVCYKVFVVTLLFFFFWGLI